MNQDETKMEKVSSAACIEMQANWNERPIEDGWREG